MTFPTIDELVDEKVATQLSEAEAKALFEAGMISYLQARDGITSPEMNSDTGLLTPLQYWWL